MSLPPTTASTSDKPGANSVTSPVNKDNKEADIDRKIRFFGVIQAFRDGRYPDNKQIDRTLKYVLNNSPVDESKLSPDGRKLVQDTRDIIETARLIVAEKNTDELFQNFMWNTRNVEFDKAKKSPDDVLPVDGEKAQADRQQAAQHLRTLLNLIATNSEVRKLLSDFSLIGRDLLAITASKAADTLRPDPEALAGVDHSAPPDQFKTSGGRNAGPNETPVLEATIPGVDGAVRHHPKQGTEVERNGERMDGSEAFDRTKVNGLGAAQVAKDRAQAEADIAAQQAQDDTLDPEEKKKGFMSRFNDMKNNLSDRVPQEHKDNAREKLDRSRHFLTEEYFPEERRDQFIYRGKKVILECQKHNDYQESIRWLLAMVEEYVGHGQTIAEHGKDSHSSLNSDPNLKVATVQIRTLLERFANGQSLDVIFSAIDNLIRDARSDEEFRAWFRSVDAYVRKVLLEPGYVIEPVCNSEGQQLKESGRKFYDDRYKAHFDGLFEAIGKWFGAMGEDPLNKRFGDDWARLTKDLLFDSEGSLKFKPELWLDIRKVILPTLVDQVGYVPIPRIEYTDDSLDLVVENLTLQGRNLFPNVVSIEAHNYMKFSPYNAIKDENHHEFTLTLGHIQADMRDVAFYFRKKTGFPKITDSGLADVVLGGQGLTAVVHLVSADKDKSSVFKVKNVNVKLDSLKFSIRDSKHDTLYKTLKPLATGLVKRQIQKAVEDAITTGMEYVDGQLVGVRDRMHEASARPDTNRTQALQELFQRKKEEGAEVTSKASSKTNSQFKVVSKRDSAILPGTGHPAGWVNRVQDRQDAVQVGDGWKSEAFNVV